MVRVCALAGLAVVIALSGAAAFAQDQPAASVARKEDARLRRGHDLFNDYGCGICHILQDAAAYGDTAPSLDGNPNLTGTLIMDRVANGRGEMPGFANQLTPDDIATIAAYIKQAAKKPIG